MGTLGWKPVGDPCTRLLDAIEECEATWGDDAAYRDICLWLDKVEQELEVIQASPGHRAALRANPPNAAGQRPEDRSESKSYVQ